MKQKTRLHHSFLRKWRKLNENRTLADFLPETRMYSSSTLHDFFNIYETIVIKPDSGLPRDVIYLQTKSSSPKEWTKKNNQNDLKIITGYYQNNMFYFLGLKSLEFWLDLHQEKKLFLIQQGIHLFPLNDVPYKVRTIVQKNESGIWEVTGMFSKPTKQVLSASDPLFQVQSVRSDRQSTKISGTRGIVSVDDYFRRIGMNSEELSSSVSAITQLSLSVAQHLGNYYTNQIYGLDLGVDLQGKLWILEIFTKPNISNLYKIDRTMYARAIKLQKIFSHPKSKGKKLKRAKPNRTSFKRKPDSDTKAQNK